MQYARPFDDDAVAWSLAVWDAPISARTEAAAKADLDYYLERRDSGRHRGSRPESHPLSSTAGECHSSPATPPDPLSPSPGAVSGGFGRRSGLSSPGPKQLNRDSIPPRSLPTRARQAAVHVAVGIASFVLTVAILLALRGRS